MDPGISFKDVVVLALEFIVVFIAVVSFVWRAVKLPINFKIDTLETRVKEGMATQVERVNSAMAQTAANVSSINELRRYDQQHSFEIASITKELGKVEGMILRLGETLDAQGHTTTMFGSDTKERLARIETSLGVFTQLNEVLVMVLKEKKRRTLLGNNDD